MEKISELKEALTPLYSRNGNERCGFVLGDGTIIEVQNVCSNPAEGFDISAEDIILYTEEHGATCTWHTHPNQSSNLSGEDYIMFNAWPNLKHMIVGSDGVKGYQYNLSLKALLEVADDQNIQT